MNVFEELKQRGLIAQMTHEDEIKKLFDEEKVTFYIGFDPTADSLHIGHYLQLVVMAHMQRAGHRPIALLGGGTTMIGDPTGKSDMRRMMTREEIDHNANCFKAQMSKLVDFSDGKALMVNNADWLFDLNYIQFLREVGVHFSVNRMLAQECFKKRLETGLSFMEFNYTLMQSYDFVVLNREYGCKVQFGGDDQWSNIIGGVELLRRSDNKDAYGMTFTLLTTSEGKKMGKTEKGAVWLDPEKTSSYEFYQYWRNIGDADVVRCLYMLTFVPVETIQKEYENLEGAALNVAKERLAFEVTKQIHGEEEAQKAQEAARALFGAGNKNENMPTAELPASAVEDGVPILDLLTLSKIVSSKSEARRLVTQGGITVNDEKISDINAVIPREIFLEDSPIIRKGKKAFFRINLV